MVKKEPSEYKRKYDLFRHHAWAGLGFLSIMLAIRIIFPELSWILHPIIAILIIYVAVSLIFTYKYSSGLSAKQEVLPPPKELEMEKLQAEVEKEKLKLEKKKAKTDSKAKKKEYKK